MNSAAAQSPVVSPRGIEARLGDVFDALFTLERRIRFKRVVVHCSIAGLLIHLGLVFLARHLDEPPAVVAQIGTNYLDALYTPFSIVLFYEVLLLILAIPESTTRSLGKQYEILSLIVIRNVFKDVAAFESVTELSQQLDEFIALLLDMAGGLLMFLLVAVFYHVNARRPRPAPPDPDLRRQIETFVGRKKVIALLLSAVLFALAATSLATWSLDALRVVRDGGPPTVDVRTVFFIDLFSVMIFADVVILILSLLLPSYYELVFRNAAFIVSTILIRFSLAVQKPYDVEIGLLSMAFGTLVLLVYNYSLKVSRLGPEQAADPGPARSEA